MRPISMSLFWVKKINMKTIRFKVDGKDRYFTPASSARRRDESEEVFFRRCVKKVVPEGETFDILEDVLYAGFMQTQQNLQRQTGPDWKNRLSRFSMNN